MKVVILQGGKISCPICGNNFSWSFKLTKLSDIWLDYSKKTPTEIISTPHKYISYVLTSDNNVRFTIGCQQCGTSIETDKMALINKENYEHNKWQNEFVAKWYIQLQAGNWCVKNTESRTSYGFQYFSFLNFSFAIAFWVLS